MSGDTTASEGVQLRFLVVRDLPLLVAAVHRRGRGAQLLDALDRQGLPSLSGFLGHELPRGARVGFLVDGDALRLLDEHETVLLRAARDGVDPDWLAAARRVRGTMFVVLDDVDLDPQQDPRALAEHVDTLAATGRVTGGIVGVVEERPQLPLLF